MGGPGPGEIGIHSCAAAAAMSAAENPVLIAEDFLSLSLTEHTWAALALTEEKIRFGACLESCSATKTFSVISLKGGYFSQNDAFHIGVAEFSIPFRILRIARKDQAKINL